MGLKTCSQTPGGGDLGGPARSAGEGKETACSRVKTPIGRRSSLCCLSPVTEHGGKGDRHYSRPF